MTIGQLGRVSEALGVTLRVRLDVSEHNPLLDACWTGLAAGRQRQLRPNVVYLGRSWLPVPDRRQRPTRSPSRLSELVH
jgi:hypothetical protein